MGRSAKASERRSGGKSHRHQPSLRRRQGDFTENLTFETGWFLPTTHAKGFTPAHKEIPRMQPKHKPVWEDLRSVVNIPAGGRSTINTPCQIIGGLDNAEKMIVW
jgi:hypothetical protein